MENKTPAELALDSVRILIWPCLVLFAFFWFKDPIAEILVNRQWKIGIVEVGDKVTNLQDNLQEQLKRQLNFLSKIRESKNDPNTVDKLVSMAEESIESTKTGVKKEIQSIQNKITTDLQPEQPPQTPSIPIQTIIPQQVTGQPAQSSSGRVELAKSLELLGFKSLLEKDVESSISYFSKLETMWPDYHNASEIKKLLVANRSELSPQQSPKWRDVYKEILAKYSWGMPSDIFRKMQQMANPA